MKNCILLTILTLAAMCSIQRGMAQGVTAFYYTSSSNSLVGLGRTELMTGDEYSFTAVSNFLHGVSLTITRSNSVIIMLEFAGPSPEYPCLTNGDYFGARTYPHSGKTGAPEMRFAAYGTDDVLSGEFTVLEVSYGSGSNIDSFAADFVEYEHGLSNRWDRGSIRFNSTIAVPEASTLKLLVSGICGLSFVYRRTRSKRCASSK